MRWIISASSDTINRDISFVWRNVNTALNTEEFSLKSLGLPEGTIINDHRFPKPKVVGAVGGALKDGVLQPSSSIEGIERSRNWWLIGFNVSVVFLLVIWIAFRKWHVRE